METNLMEKFCKDVKPANSVAFMVLVSYFTLTCWVSFRHVIYILLAKQT